MNLIRKTGEIESIIAYYLLILGSYRGWYYSIIMRKTITTWLQLSLASYKQLFIRVSSFICVQHLSTNRKEKDYFIGEQNCPLDSVYTDNDREFRMERAARRLMTENGLETGLTSHRQISISTTIFVKWFSVSLILMTPNAISKKSRTMNNNPPFGDNEFIPTTTQHEQWALITQSQ